MANPPSRDGSRVQSWTAGELRRFLEDLSGDRFAAMWRLDATTGMRRVELAGLTWRARRAAVSQSAAPAD
jgi:integrase